MMRSICPFCGEVRTRHVHGDTPTMENGTGASIIKLVTIVTLEALNSTTKLIAHISKKIG
jgi:hypothetical protein